MPQRRREGNEDKTSRTSVKKIHISFSQPMLAQQISGLECKTCSQEEAVTMHKMSFFHVYFSSGLQKEVLGDKREVLLLNRG